ncbi:MAG: DUF349 domain-containing protein [Bacteroidetes bacterium]|nr:DUF349 domain-containing protein [Bacteroidota bacterium]
MDEIMTQIENTATTLQEWWNAISFAGKNNYTLNEAGELTQQQVGQLKERVVTTLSADTADVTLKALQDKFSEAQYRCKELLVEWENTSDKLKLIGKAERFKDYLQEAAVVGEVNTLEKFIANIETELHKLVEENFIIKKQMAEEAETIAAGDNWKEGTQKLKDLAERWKKAGYLDKHRNEELWNRIEAAKNSFFERKRQNQEDVSKELLANLDLKMEMVEKAEKLAASEEWKEATEGFHNLMEEWKKTGRTIHEKNEELWHKFITAKNSFFDRKKAHFDTIQVEQEANLVAKMALLEKAEALQNSTEWGSTAQAFTQLMEEWKKIGRAPAEKADEIWNRFIAAKETFFNAKKQHSETLKVSLQDNLAQKMALLKRAESLQNSTHWRETTDEMIELMEEWKKIGPVPREYNDDIWNKFTAARKKFFERKDANREHRKHVAEKHKSQRVQQTYDFVRKLEEELKEEEDRLADFKEGIQNITPGKKEAELRAHLTKLIEQTEHKIQHKQEKLAEARKQVDDLESKSKKESDKTEA